VIIWLKRCLARSLTDSVLEVEPVGAGVGVGVGVGAGEADTFGVGEGDKVGVGVGDGGVGLCAEAGMVSAAISSSETAAAGAAEPIRLRANPAIVSARTACRWDRCRHRQSA